MPRDTCARRPNRAPGATPGTGARWSVAAGMHSARRQARACRPLLAALLALCAAASTTAAPGQEAHAAGKRIVRGRPAVRTHDLVRGLGAARRVRGAALPRQFLYVYEMPPEFTEDEAALPVQWHPEQYDFDQARAAQLGPYQGLAVA